MELNEDEPAVIKAVLEWLYFAHYNCAYVAEATLFHVDVFIAADKFMLPILQKDAAHKFRKKLYKTCYTLNDVIFVAIVGKIYGNHAAAASELRDDLVRYAVEASLMTNISAGTQYHFRGADEQSSLAFLQDHPAFAADLAMGLMKETDKIAMEKADKAAAHSHDQ